MEGHISDTADECLSLHLDRLESVLAQKDSEVRRLKTELHQRRLYLRELHTLLEKQVLELGNLDRRLKRLEPSDLVAQKPTLPLLIRVKKTG